MSRADRAKQFLPFDALRGFYKLVNNYTKEKEDRRFLDEDELERLNNVLSLLKKGDMVEIIYYNFDHYEKITGLVSRIDYLNKKIRIVKTDINVYDIIDAIKIDRE